MKLDLGCGYKKRAGYTRVDWDDCSIPDVLHDLNKFPWPFEDNTVDEILMIQVLEHLAPLPDDYKKLWQEIYRICKPGALIQIEVPHWKHDNMLHDPTHVRAITPVTIAMMDQTRNQNDINNGGCETTLGLQWKVDFKLDNAGYGNDPMTGEPVFCQYKVIVVKPCRLTNSKD